MNKKTLALVGIAVIILLVGGLVWYFKKQSTQETPVQSIQQEPTTKSDNIDTSDWKTYRNEEYGFLVRYPENWLAKEFYSAGVGSPISCENTPEKCTKFEVKFSDMEEKHQPVFFEAAQLIEPKEEGVNITSDTSNLEFHRTGETDAGFMYTKNSHYFPIYGSCFMSTGIPDAVLKKGATVHFFTFYEVPSDLYTPDDALAENYCSKEIHDPIFDKIVESFQVIP